MKNNKLKNWSAGILHFTFGQIVYWSEQAKEANGKNQFKVPMVTFSTKCISLFENDQQFLYFVLKQRLSGLKLITGVYFTVHLCLTDFKT